jgi:hypothetical protein
MPGYPGFLAFIYSLGGTGRNPVLVAQAFIDLATCVLAVCIAWRLAAGASEPVRTRIAIAALWLAALCPFTANYAAVPLTEVLTIFLTTLAVLIFLHPLPINSISYQKGPTCSVLSGRGFSDLLWASAHSFVQKLLCSSCLSCLSIGCAGGGH